MLRPFLLALIVVGAGVSSVGEVTQPSDVATWRWQVATILDAQRGDKQCGNCRLFQAPSSCLDVQGPISEHCSCRIWLPPLA